MKISKWQRAQPEFDRLTGINPVHAADRTIHELRCHFWVELPKSLEAELVQRAETVFARHKRWRKKAQGQHGADYVRSYMRHWLAALLFKHKHPLFRELPSEYKTGRALPETSRPFQRELEMQAIKQIRKLQKAFPPSRIFVHGCELLLP